MFSVAEKIPRVWALSNEIASGMQAGKYSEWDVLMDHLSPLVEPDFIDEIDRTIPGWRKIATLHKGVTAKHTLLVLSSCLNLTEYQQAGPQTQRELEWSAVLHDLDKEKVRSDTAHPFRSAAVVNRIMPMLGFALRTGLNPAYPELWSQLVLASQRADGDRMIHDHTRLRYIIAGLHDCWGEGTPAARILKAILLHQSLPALKDWANAVLLTDEELAYSLTLADMEVLGPLMIADSDSWNIFDEPRTAYLAELRESNAETCRRIQENMAKH
jgi:hypothetical protein